MNKEVRNQQPKCISSTVHLAVVIPAYQEERLLPVTLAGLPLFIKTIIVIDDASTDRTREVALEFAKKVDQENKLVEKKESQFIQRQVKVLSLTKNSGVGRAICTGYVEAQKLGADIAVVMGADNQMDPQEVSGLLEGFQPGIVYVKGDRMSHPDVRIRMPSIRFWGNKILSKLTGWLMSYPELSDAQCGFTAIKLSYLAEIDLNELYPRYGFPNDLLLRLAEKKLSVAQVPVTPIYATEQSKLSIPRVLFPLLLLFSKATLRRINISLHKSSSQ